MVSKPPEGFMNSNPAEQELRQHLDQLKSQCETGAAGSYSSGYCAPTPKVMLSSSEMYSPVT